MNDKLKSTGGQIPCMYGLAKTHKVGIPLRPIVAMIGSPYDKIGCEMSKWLRLVESSQINCKSKMIVEKLTKINLSFLLDMNWLVWTLKAYILMFR